MKAKSPEIENSLTSESVEITAECIERLKQEAVARLGRKLRYYNATHAAIIKEHALAYLHKSQLTKSRLFDRYLDRLLSLNNDPRWTARDPLRPIAKRTFEKLTRFNPILTHACRGTVAAARLGWENLRSEESLTDNGSNYSSVRFP